MKYTYYKSKLFREDCIVYERLIEAIHNCNKKITIDRNELFDIDLENEITKILKCVEYDHPELMHWNGDKFILEIENKEQNKFCLNLFYKEISEEKIKKNLEIIQKKENIKKDINKEMSKDEKIWNICNAIKKSWNNRGDFEVSKNLAKCFKILCDLCNVNSIIVEGSSNEKENISHFWNMVILDRGLEEERYNIDISEVVKQKNLETFQFKLSDEEISKKYKISDWFEIPKSTLKIEKFEGKYDEIASLEELKQYLQKVAAEKPFKFAVKLNYNCNLEDTGKKASEYIIRHYVKKGQKTEIVYEYFLEDKVIMFTGK